MGHSSSGEQVGSAKLKEGSGPTDSLRCACLVSSLVDCLVDDGAQHPMLGLIIEEVSE